MIQWIKDLYRACIVSLYRRNFQDVYRELEFANRELCRLRKHIDSLIEQANSDINYCFYGVKRIDFYDDVEKIVGIFHTKADAVNYKKTQGIQTNLSIFPIELGVPISD